MSYHSHLIDIVSTLPARHPFALAASVFLLSLSAVFSGGETALFSLTPPEMNRFRSGKGRIDRIVAALHSELNQLLPTILFCNMAVNVMVFAVSAVIGSSLAAAHGPAVVVAYGLFNLCVVVFCGEVFPKQFAIASRVTVARLTALPLWFCHRALVKPMRLLNAAVRACERIVDVPVPDGDHVREEEFKLLMEFSKSDGVISDDEYELIANIVDLPEIRVRDMMTPRVDTVMVKSETTCGDALKLARICGHVKLPVLDGEKDDLIGWVDMRELFLRPFEGPVGPRARAFHFFSEHDRADQALKKMKRYGDVLTAVVDERGQVIGIFTLQDIMDEMLGHIGDYGNAPPEDIVERDGTYALAGGVSIREWRELFHVSSVIPRSATVGGLVVSLLGRPARRGDTVRLENIEMTVLTVWRNRVTWVRVRFVPETPAEGEGGT